MKPRWQVLLILAAVSLFWVGCSEAPPPEVASTRDPEKEALIKFWRHYEEATQLRLAGEIESAALTYAQALSLNAEHEESLYYLGQCQREMDRYSESIETYGRLLAVNPQSVRGHSALGAALSSPDERAPLALEIAEEHFRRAIELNSEETGPVIRLGEVLVAQGELAEAGKWLEAAVLTNPRSVEAAFLAGYVRWKTGDPQQAEVFLGKAIGTFQPEAPIEGVLGEGDRMPASSEDPKDAPATPSMLGTTLFGEVSNAIHKYLDSGSPAAFSPTVLDQAFAPVDSIIGKLENRQPHLSTSNDRVMGGPQDQ